MRNDDPWQKPQNYAEKSDLAHGRGDLSDSEYNRTIIDD